VENRFMEIFGVEKDMTYSKGRRKIRLTDLCFSVIAALL